MASANDKILNDLIRHKVMLLQYGNNQARQAVARLLDGDKRIKSALYSALIEMDSTVWLPAYDKLMSGIMTPVMMDLFIEAMSVINDELPEFIEHELAYMQALVTGVLPDEIKPLASPKTIKPAPVISAIRKTPVMGATISQYPAALADSAVKAMTSRVKALHNQGATKTQIVDELTPVNSAFFAQQKNNVSAVAKTLIGAAASETRDSFMQENSNIVKARQWVSTLDTHTTPMCIVRDLLLYSVSKPVQPIGHDIPYGAGPGRLHYGCRSEESIVLKSIDELGLTGEFSGATRASMGGQVPAGLKYSDWLAKQDAYTQEQVLGIQRAMMVRKGKIKIPELFSDTGEYIPLAELKRRDLALQN